MIRSFLHGLAIALVVLWIISMGWGFVLLPRSDSLFFGTIGSFISVLVFRVARYFTPARSRSVAILGRVLGFCALPLLGLVIVLVMVATGYIPSKCLKEIRHIECIRIL